MRAGRLNQRVTLQEAATATNAIGETQTTFSDVGTLWAAIEPTKSDETVTRNGSTVTEQTYRVILRYRSDVTTACRLQWGDSTLELLSVINPYNENKRLECIAVEVN